MDTKDQPKKSKKILGNATILSKNLWNEKASKIKEKSEQYRENDNEPEDLKSIKETKKPDSL